MHRLPSRPMDLMDTPGKGRADSHTNHAIAAPWMHVTDYGQLKISAQTCHHSHFDIRLFASSTSCADFIRLHYQSLELEAGI